MSELYKKLIPEFLLSSELYLLAITDLGGYYLFANELFEKRFASREDIIGKHFSMTIHPDEIEKCNLIAYQCIAQPGKTFQLQLRKKDESQSDFYWTKWEFSLFKDSDGNPAGILCLGYDITKAEIASWQAKEFAQKLDSMIERITDGFYVLNREWEFVEINQTAEKILNKTRQELIGRKIWDLFPGLPHYNYPEQFRKAMSECITVAFEDYRGDLDKWFHVFCYPSPEGLNVFFRDITQEKKIQQQLKDSETRLRAVLDSAADSHILISPDYKVLSFNKKANEFSMQLLGKPLTLMANMWEYTAPGTEQAFYENSQKALKGENVIIEREIFYHQTGKKLWFEVSYLPTYSDDGNILGFTFNAVNIDARKKAEEKLHQSEIMLRAIYDSSDESLNLIDTNYKIIYNNKLSKQITRMIFGKEAQIGDSSMDFYVPELREEFASYYERVLRGETITLEKEHNGIWWLFKLYPVYDNENRIFGIATNFKDITRRKKQDLELKEIKHRLDKTIEAIPHPLLTVDAENLQITYVNAEFERVFGYTEKELLGKEVDILLPEKYRKHHRLLQKEYVKKGGLLKNRNRYLPALIKDGSEIYVDASLNTFVANDKLYAILILQDVTEKKKQQDQILKQNETLKRIAWQQSHEVRRPVANILGLCELFKNYENESEEMRKKYIEYMIHSAEELDRVIHKVISQTSEVNFDKNE